MTRRVRLPHEGEEVDRLIRQIKDAVVETRTTVIAGVEVTYSICDPWPLEPEPAIHDHYGNIYVPARRFNADAMWADLSAYHEHVEVGHKLAGRSHAYAHRRALLHELLAARDIYDEDGLREYVRYRVFNYPAWKIPDRSAVEKGICELLSADRPLRGKLVEAITRARM